MKKLLLIVFLFTIVKNTRATHMMGGEITYVCNGNNNFSIKLSLFTDCLTGEPDAILQDSPAFIAIYENTPSPTYINSYTADITSSRIVPLEFSNDCVSSLPTLCMKEGIFNYNITLPSSSFGYTVVYQRCCRNHSIANIGLPGNKGVTYYTVIPPNETSNCNDNSPVFNNQPPQVICVNNPFTYDFSAEDSDGDSLVYRLCETYGGGSISNPKPNGDQISGPPFPSIPYNFGFSPSNPLPSFPPLAIEAETGNMSGYPIALGRYQVSVCIDQYRDGTFFGTIYRDLQFYVTNCSRNVIANTPLFSDEPNTYIINCSNLTVDFKNTSTGGFSYVWDFGDGSPTSTEFEPTHTYAAPGTYEVTLIVNEGSTCMDSITRIVKVYPTFTADFTFNGNNCPFDTLSFFENIVSTHPNPYTFSWDFGDGTTSTESNPKHSYQTSGDFNVTLKAVSEMGCISIYDTTIKIIDFQPNAGNDTVIVLGYDFYLNATGGENYFWSPSTYLSNPNIANPQVNFPDTGMYTFVVGIGAAEGCQANDTINVLVVKDPSILMPSAFSPNGDGQNDVFQPVIVGYPYINYFQIFNRWGQRVFRSYKHSEGWDGTYGNGKTAEQGVYFWEISVKKLDGTSVIQKGDVTLIK